MLVLTKIKKMNKIMMIIAAATFIGATASAQGNGSDSRENVHFGVKAGANISNVYDTEGADFVADPKLGFAAGAFVAIPIGKFIGVQPEILFSQKGYQRTGNVFGSDYKFTHTSNYIEVPILLQVKPSEMITLLAGPQYSYLIKEKNVFSNEYVNGSNEQDFENDNVRKNTLGFVGGVDINLNQLVVGVRAAWDLQNNNGDGTSNIPTYKNVVYQATVGYRF